MNPRQTRFVEEYAIDHNATQAAIRSGYSPKTAYSQGQRLLKHVEISQALHQQEQATSSRLQLTHEWVIQGLMDLAIEAKSDAARVRAYELLGKHQGMFTDRVEISQIPDRALVAEWITALEDDLAGDT